MNEFIFPVVVRLAEMANERERERERERVHPTRGMINFIDAVSGFRCHATLCSRC